ncbi:MAG: AAA family ATPase [Rickettsiales bacterium]|nr:AAA family ATPase [Rickettsiales bacterium]OUV53213.1 MAG: hypothetical protein CBC87_04920 [Rickettsiales bacterium TMED127]|tara:strand:+ start:13418 stop:14383 length:966 start_codon:yes stop_codon:yes gene_type:complete
MSNTEKKIKDSIKVFEQIRKNISSVFYGQKTVVDEVMTSILSSGNTLLIGVPGLGKTLLFQTLSEILKLKPNRIQCTPDLMPSDILGVEVLTSKNNDEFKFIKGPIFCQLLMIDEINRASPKTQSALLQAMQEGFVSVGGKNLLLPKPFIVLATQNPIEQEGTYNLPEAQLDRFTMNIHISYPDYEIEKEILLKSKSVYPKINNFNSDDLLRIIKLVDLIPVGESVINFILKLIRNLRPESTKFDFVKKFIKWGPGPRGGIALLNSTKSYSFIKGTLSPSISDVIMMSKACLRHRISVNFEAKTDQITSEYIIKRVCENLD